jgi:hypothetical protein
MKTYTKAQLIKKYAGKYIDTYPHHRELWDDKKNCWVTTYEVRGVSKTVRENYNLPEDCIKLSEGSRY